MFRWKATAAVVAAAALALAGCAGGSDSTGDDASGGGTLTLVAILAPQTFDPAQSQWGNQSPFYQATYDTLLLATPEGTIEPWLASDFAYNEDNTELTLTLRDDVTFTDGQCGSGEGWGRVDHGEGRQQRSLVLSQHGHG